MVDIIRSLVVFFLVFGVLIILHELGHFFTARFFGVLVQEFGFGMPPRIKAWKRGETEYAINAIPIGGYVRLLGEDGEITEDKRNFQHKPAYQRAIILFAGGLVHLVLAVVLFGVLALSQGAQKATDSIVLFDISPSSPAAEAGLLADDQVLRVGSDRYYDATQFINTVTAQAGNPVALTIYRPSEAKIYHLTLTPRVDPPAGQGALGVLVGYQTYTIPVSILGSAKEGVVATYEIVKYSLEAAGDIVRKLVRASLPEGISGPVGIASASGDAFKYGGVNGVLFLMALLAANLAVFNLLPFPGLDGGRIFFIIIEKLRGGKKVALQSEAIVHAVGLGLLFLLLAVVTYRDILKLFGA